MTSDLSELQRRILLQTAAGLAIGHMASRASGAESATGTPQGKIGEFNFLAGEWKIKHQRLKSVASANSPAVWDEFEGEATCWTVLGGVGSIEELRIPARKFSGIGILLLDLENKLWSDFWVNGSSGVLAPPGMTGHFENGVGTFVADDADGNPPTKARGVWDRITATSCRWHQAVSKDGGQVWEPNWFMDWVRA